MAAVIDTGMATVKVCVLVWGEDKHSTGESASDVLLVDVGVGVEGGGGHGGKGAYWIPCMVSFLSLGTGQICLDTFASAPT